jgi:hypothetical protein
VVFRKPLCLVRLREVQEDCLQRVVVTHKRILQLRPLHDVCELILDLLCQLLWLWQVVLDQAQPPVIKVRYVLVLGVRASDERSHELLHREAVIHIGALLCPTKPTSHLSHNLSLNPLTLRSERLWVHKLPVVKVDPGPAAWLRMIDIGSQVDPTHTGRPKENAGRCF